MLATGTQNNIIKKKFNKFIFLFSALLKWKIKDNDYTLIKSIFCDEYHFFHVLLWTNEKYGVTSIFINAFKWLYCNIRYFSPWKNHRLWKTLICYFCVSILSWKFQLWVYASFSEKSFFFQSSPLCTSQIGIIILLFINNKIQYYL